MTTQLETEVDLSVRPSLDRRRWLILAILCLALVVVGIDGTIVNVALPTFVRELGASPSELQWIVDAYTIVFASFLLIAGNTGDRLGRKWCFLGGLVGPRRAELTRRLVSDHHRLRVPIEAAVDQLLGPIFYRALLVDAPVDGELLDSVIASIVGPEDR